MAAVGKRFLRVKSFKNVKAGKGSRGNNGTGSSKSMKLSLRRTLVRLVGHWALG